MVDMSCAEIRGIVESVWGSKVIVRVCYFHVVQAWKRWLRRAANRIENVTDRNKILGFITTMKKSSSPREANELWTTMVQYLQLKGLDHVIVHFYNDYVTKSKSCFLSYLCLQSI